MARTHIAEILFELQESLTDPSHPFRQFCLATGDPDGYPGLRTVILRSIAPGLNLSFFTDVRSAKVEQMRKNPCVSLLFYHPGKHWQLRIEGQARIREGEQSASLWDGIPLESRKNYTSRTHPGSKISSPADVKYISNATFFCVVEINSRRIESLQLQYTPHRRRLLYKENHRWEVTYLVP